jgi:hypothetical protein
MIGRKGHCRSRSTKVILTATACCVRACVRQKVLHGWHQRRPAGQWKNGRLAGLGLAAAAAAAPATVGESGLSLIHVYNSRVRGGQESLTGETRACTPDCIDKKFVCCCRSIDLTAHATEDSAACLVCESSKRRYTAGTDYACLLFLFHDFSPSQICFFFNGGKSLASFD